MHVLRRCFPAAIALAVAAIGMVVASTPAGAAPAPTANLTAVSCPRAGFCMAVGETGRVYVSAAPLAMSWNGQSWADLPFPQPPKAVDVELSGVQCTSARYCIVVGDYTARGATNTTLLAARWNGTSWSLVLDAGAGLLTAVSCSAYNACTAVGGTNWQTGDYYSLPVAERWNDKRWTREREPTFYPAGGIALTGVACPSAQWCIAAGYNSDFDDVQAPIAERWTASAGWKATAISVPPAPAPGVTLTTTGPVSCSSARGCTVIGASNDPGGLYNIALADRWAGSKWTSPQLPGTVSFTDPDYAYIGGLSCPTASLCMAVAGQQTDVWNGTAWAVQSATNPDTGATLDAIACPSASVCTAVGSTSLTSDGTSPLAESWTGTTWAIQPTP